DLLDQRGEFLAEPPVGRDVYPARRRHLHEAELPLQFRVEDEKAVYRAQALGNAFGVVHPVHADEEKPIAHAKALAYPPFLLLGLPWRRRGHQIGIDADGLRPDVGGPAAAGDGEALHVYPRLQGALYRLQKVVAVVLEVEGEQVVAQQAVEDFLLPRADAEHLAVWPRNVPEVQDHQVRAGVFEHAGQQREVVVLHEDHRWFIPDL